MTCCKTAALSLQLDNALSQGFPASDPAAVTEPAGDARDVAGCCCAEKAERAAPEPTPKLKTAGCCGGT